MINMSKIEIPVAKSEEAEVLQSISMSAFKENYKKYGHYPPGIELVEWHKDKIKNDIYHTILYEKEIVGGLHMISYPNDEMKIEYLFISPEYQGKKIGATVMALIEKEYKGVTKWFLLTPFKDYRNHHFYEKLGYEKVGEIQPIEKNEFTLFEYEKLINT